MEASSWPIRSAVYRPLTFLHAEFGLMSLWILVSIALLYLAPGWFWKIVMAAVVVVGIKGLQAAFRADPKMTGVVDENRRYARYYLGASYPQPERKKFLGLL